MNTVKAYCIDMWKEEYLYREMVGATDLITE